MSKKEVKGVAYTCDYCKKDITKVVRIRCAVCLDFDLCVECFSVGVEVNTDTNQHLNSHDYYVIVCRKALARAPSCSIVRSRIKISLSLSLPLCVCRTRCTFRW